MYTHQVLVLCACLSSQHGGADCASCCTSVGVAYSITKIRVGFSNGVRVLQRMYRKCGRSFQQWLCERDPSLFVKTSFPVEVPLEHLQFECKLVPLLKSCLEICRGEQGGGNHVPALEVSPGRQGENRASRVSGHLSCSKGCSHALACFFLSSSWSPLSTIPRASMRATR